LIDALNSTAVTLLGTPLSYAESAGFATGLVCVWLTARRNIWNFPVGIANCALLLLLFVQARLFADAGLQILFIALGIRGWWQWAQGTAVAPKPITTATPRELAIYAATSVVLTGALFGLLTLAKGSLPIFDALITALSVVAQWLLNRKTLQNWFWWIAVDVISIPVYIHKELYLIALLYAIFLALCLFGLASWRGELQRERATNAAAAVTA
jgi:nicotinamide mononucleotide transporter